MTDSRVRILSADSANVHVVLGYLVQRFDAPCHMLHFSVQFVEYLPREE